MHLEATYTRTYTTLFPPQHIPSLVVCRHTRSLLQRLARQGPLNNQHKTHRSRPPQAPLPELHSSSSGSDGAELCSSIHLHDAPSVATDSPRDHQASVRPTTLRCPPAIRHAPPDARHGPRRAPNPHPAPPLGFPRRGYARSISIRPCARMGGLLPESRARDAPGCCAPPSPTQMFARVRRRRLPATVYSGFCHAQSVLIP